MDNRLLFFRLVTEVTVCSTLWRGGTVTSGGTIGKEIGSSGTVNVSGTGSKWNASYVYVGNAGSGVLDVNNGGVVDNSGDSYIGYETGSTGQATVSGENSKWDMADCGEFDIGHYGTGELSISGGGYVINNWSKHWSLCWFHWQRDSFRPLRLRDRFKMDN